jgi:hypothetical protein
MNQGAGSGVCLGGDAAMNPDEEFARILQRLAPLSGPEKAEALLAYFSAAIQSMDTASLVHFRAYCFARDEGTDAETTMLQIIDGQLALREIAAAGR